MFLKQFFTLWYLVFALLSSSAWALTDHQNDDHGSLSSTGHGHDTVLSLTDDGCDDHCCHAAAHTVALLSTEILFMAPGCTDYRPLSTVQLRPFQHAPPYHPPIP